MDNSSLRPLIDNDLESAPFQTSVYSGSFVDRASNNKRTPSTALSITTGTGYHVYKDLIIPHILSANHEVILVTCFWAPSATLTAIHSALLQLSERAVERRTRISVHICFSTYSLARNLLLPTDKRGQSYGPSKWQKLGLPHVSQIPGLTLRVTRKFDWPWGIMHSKYVVVDRAISIFPSCNVSWERWFECAISMHGPVVEHLLKFHAWFWENDSSLPQLLPSPPATHSTTNQAISTNSAPTPPLPTSTRRPTPTLAPALQVPNATTLLPSPHTPTLLPPHLSPRRLVHRLPCLPTQPPTHPPTPLLTTTTHLLTTAQRSITLISPNITAPTVLANLRTALERGVSVTIWTNKFLMVAEQLVTAGATTPSCLVALQRWWRSEQSRNNTRPRTGSLKVHYFDDEVDGPGAKNQRALQQQNQRRTKTKTSGGRHGHRAVPLPPVHPRPSAAGGDASGENTAADNETRETTPVKLHAKVTIVDGDKILLGSGNMDAASWGTSQELGVLVESAEIVTAFVAGYWPWGGLDGTGR